MREQRQVRVKVSIQAKPGSSDPMNDSARAQIDWSTAEINDGTLSVAVEGHIPKGWTKHFDGVIALLESSSSGWGEIALHKKTITVAEVQQGSEDDVRHLLESAVLQANTDLGQHDTSATDPQTAQERAMTDTFRSFSQPMHSR